MKKIIIQIFIVLLLISCQNNSKSKNVKKASQIHSENKYDIYTRFNDVEKRNELKKKLFKGDKSAYKELQEIYGLSGNYPEFTYFSMIFANKFNDNDACSSVHSLFVDSNDSLSQNIANLYLIKAYQNGYDEKITLTKRKQIIDSLRKRINFDSILKSK